MSHELSLKEIKNEYHGSFRSYVIGFISSLLLTGISFSLVITRVIAESHTIYAIVALAVLQAIIQLLFFLHLGKEDKPRWETLVFYFMALILVIVILGTLWVMFDLNSRVMHEM